MISLVWVELRKTFNTRAAKWFTGVMLLATLGLTWITAFSLSSYASDPPPAEVTGGVNLTFSIAQVANTSTNYLITLVAILAIINLGNEFSNRTALSTFTLVPQRWKVVSAKVIAAAVTVVVAVGLGFGIGYLAFQMTVSENIPHDSTVTAYYLAALLVTSLLQLLFAFGLALLLQNTIAAIMGYMLIPLAMQMGLIIANKAIKDSAQWWDMSTLNLKLLVPEMPNPLLWDRFIIVTIIWAVIPISIGLWRLLNREISSD